jgi:hypothetical protein
MGAGRFFAYYVEWGSIILSDVWPYTSGYVEQAGNVQGGTDMINRYHHNLAKQDVVRQQAGDEGASAPGPEAKRGVERRMANLVDTLLVLIVFLSVLAVVY